MYPVLTELAPTGSTAAVPGMPATLTIVFVLLQQAEFFSGRRLSPFLVLHALDGIAKRRHCSASSTQTSQRNHKPTTTATDSNEMSGLVHRRAGCVCGTPRVRRRSFTTCGAPERGLRGSLGMERERADRDTDTPHFSHTHRTAKKRAEI